MSLRALAREHSQCHRQLSGPGDFIIWFQTGRLKFSHSSRLMCYIGEYEVQAICFPLSGSESGVCGSRCEDCRLVTIQSDLSVPSSSSSRYPSTQDREFPGKRSYHSSGNWPCFTSSISSSKVQEASSKFVFLFQELATAR